MLGTIVGGNTMYKHSLLLIASVALVDAVAQNSCMDALPITAGTYVVDSVVGGDIPAPLCAQTAGSGTAGEWYSYTTTMDTLVTITTLTSAVDTRVHVYEGACGSLQCVAGDDDAGQGNAASVSFVAQTGVPYTIAFDDRWSADGFTFELVEAQIPNTTGQVTFTALSMSGWTQGQSLGTVDMNGDHLDDLVVPGTTELFIAHQLPGGGFLPFNFPHPDLALSSVLDFAAGNLDHNGFNDMLYGGIGVSFMMANSDGTAYTELSFPEFVFCQRTNMVDINNDGNLDGFACHDVGANVHYIGDGSGGLGFHQGDFGTTSGNYASIWIDHDNDGDLDLYISKCGGDPLDQLWNNNGDGTFTDVAPDLGFALDHQTWSSAWGDYDNDGDMDVLAGSSGNSDHLLFRNDLGSYTNVSAGAGAYPPRRRCCIWRL